FWSFLARTNVHILLWIIFLFFILRCASKAILFPYTTLFRSGSASKGRTSRYYYYHCVSSCGFRQKAELANDIFEKSMRQFALNRSEEHTSELQSRFDLVCRLLLEKKNKR